MNLKPLVGPLPISNSNEDLETISRNKLALLFDPALFELRHEEKRDKGIDLFVEIKQNGAYTNFRFAIQLKSTSSTKPNKDNSVSYPVEVSNINYLLNYGMPAYYILYEHTSERFYIENVNQVNQSLFKKHNASNFPKNFNIRFSKLFTPELIHEIYNHTLDSGVLLRKLNSHLRLSSSNSIKGITIDDDNDVYSVEQNIAFINHFGFKLLDDAEFKRIVEIEQRTHPRTHASATFNLVCGVAYYHQANLFKAVDLLKMAQKESAGFDTDTQSLLNYILLDAKYSLGMIEKKDFKEQLSQLMDSKDTGSFLKIEKAYNTFSKNGMKDIERMKLFYKAIEQILSEDSFDDKTRAMAYGRTLEAESIILINDLCENMIILICMGVPDLLKTNTFKKWLALEESYLKRFNSLVEFATNQENYLVVGILTSIRVDWAYKRTYLKHALENLNRKTLTIDGSLNKENRNYLLKCSSTMDRISKTYEILGDKEKMISCLTLKYEILHFAGYLTDAGIVSEEIARIIQDNDFNALRKRYNELINTGTSYEKFVSTLTTRLGQIYTVADNSGIERSVNKKPSKSIIEMIEKNREWSIESFLEFSFPNID